MTRESIGKEACGSCLDTQVWASGVAWLKTLQSAVSARAMALMSLLLGPPPALRQGVLLSTHLGAEIPFLMQQRSRRQLPVEQSSCHSWSQFQGSALFWTWHSALPGPPAPLRFSSDPLELLFASGNSLCSEAVPAAWLRQTSLHSPCQGKVPPSQPTLGDSPVSGSSAPSPSGQCLASSDVGWFAVRHPTAAVCPCKSQLWILMAH